MTIAARLSAYKNSFGLTSRFVREVKPRALRDIRKLKDSVAELLRTGLAAGQAVPAGVKESRLKKDRKTGLPLIECRKAAAREIKPKRAAEILLEQEIKWHDAGIRAPSAPAYSGKDQKRWSGR